MAHQHRAQLPPSTRAAADSNAKSKIVFQPLDPDDAYAMARRAPDLEAVDFLPLGQYQAYANLSANGAPAGWALIRTLPPPEPTGLGERVRQQSRNRYASPLPQAKPRTSSEPVPDTSTANDAVGRKRRSR